MLWFIFWVRKVTFHSVCMYVHVILLHCFPSLVFMFNLNKLWTDTFIRNYIVEKKEERHFIWVCMFCFHESAYWGQYFYVSNWRRDWHFTWSSEPCEGLAVCRAKAVQCIHFSVIRRWVLVWPLGMNPCPIFYSPECTWTPNICWGIKVFPLVIIYNDSQNLSSWLCNNIVQRKLRLVTLRTLRVN